MSTCKAGEVYSAARTLWVLMEQITTAADHVSLQIDAFQGCKVVFSFRYVPFEAVCREVQAVCDLQSRAILVYAPTRTRVWRVSRELRRQLAKVMGWHDQAFSGLVLALLLLGGVQLLLLLPRILATYSHVGRY